MVGPRPRPTRPARSTTRHADSPRARARLGRDPGRVSGRQVRRPRRRPRLVRRRGRAPERAAAPALALGATRVIVIGLNSSVTPAGRELRPGRAGRARAADPGRARRPARRRRRHARNRQRELARALVTERRRQAHSPARPLHLRRARDRLEIGRLAREVYRTHYAGLAVSRATATSLCSDSLSTPGAAPSTASCSAICFSRGSSSSELIALGRRDAERWLDARHDNGLWQVGRLT